MTFHTVGVCRCGILTQHGHLTTEYGGCQAASCTKMTTEPSVSKNVSNTQFERKAVMIHMAMVKDQQFGKTMRKSYAKYQEILEMPNMLKIQKDSYQWFLDEGLRESVFSLSCVYNQCIITKCNML